MIPILAVVGFVLGWGYQVAPQCLTPSTPPYLVTSGAPLTVLWLMEPTVDTTEGTVPNRYEGFYLQIDDGPKDDIGLATSSPACPSTSPWPNQIPYSYRTNQGVPRGAHQLKLSAWNYVLDSLGNPTTTRQESDVVTIPFAAVDPILFGPPVMPRNIIIGR